MINWNDSSWWEKGEKIDGCGRCSGMNFVKQIQCMKNKKKDDMSWYKRSPFCSVLDMEWSKGVGCKEI